MENRRRLPRSEGGGIAGVCSQRILGVLKQAVTCLPRDIAAYARVLSVRETQMIIDSDAYRFVSADDQPEWAVYYLPCAIEDRGPLHTLFYSI